MGEVTEKISKIVYKGVPFWAGRLKTRLFENLSPDQ